jgi:hypothetical protein
MMSCMVRFSPAAAAFSYNVLAQLQTVSWISAGVEVSPVREARHHLRQCPTADRDL